MIELDSIEEQELSKLASFAVNPQAQRLGYSSKKQYRLERDLSLAVIKGKSDCLWLAERYAKSYQADSTPTVNQYRDYLASLLLIEFVKDTQYYANSNNLTRHAAQAWESLGYKNIWPYIDSNNNVPNLYGWGPLGSLSFYTYYSPARLDYSEATWDTQIFDCLRLFWVSLGEPFSLEDDVTEINARVTRVLDRLGVTKEFVDLVTELLEVTYKETELARRRQGQALEDFNLIKQRLLFREYPESIYQDMILNAPDKLKQDLGDVNNRLLSVAKPAGFRLLLQAIVVECLLRSVLLLTELNSIWRNQPLVNYARFNAHVDFGADKVREKLAKYWVVLSDAQYIPLLFNDPLVNYQRSKNVKLWVSTVPDLDTSLTSPYRLTAFM